MRVPLLLASCASMLRKRWPLLGDFGATPNTMKPALGGPRNGFALRGGGLSDCTSSAIKPSCRLNPRLACIGGALEAPRQSKRLVTWATSQAVSQGAVSTEGVLVTRRLRCLQRQLSHHLWPLLFSEDHPPLFTSGERITPSFGLSIQPDERSKPRRQHRHSRTTCRSLCPVDLS